jgi:hypothetical protein
MTPVPDRSTFENAYSGQAPWDIGKPQKPFLDVADQITGSILDAGCGTGDTALFFAGRDHQVTGIAGRTDIRGDSSASRWVGREIVCNGLLGDAPEPTGEKSSAIRMSGAANVHNFLVVFRAKDGCVCGP